MLPTNEKPFIKIGFDNKTLKGIENLDNLVMG
jgi:hypothetical protein